MADRDAARRPKSAKKRKRHDAEPQLPPVVAAPLGDITDLSAMWRLVTANQAALMSTLQDVLKFTMEQRVLCQKAIVKTFNYDSKLLFPGA